LRIQENNERNKKNLIDIGKVVSIDWMVAYFLIITTNDIDQETTLAINEQISKKDFSRHESHGP